MQKPNLNGINYRNRGFQNEPKLKNLFRTPQIPTSCKRLAHLQLICMAIILMQITRVQFCKSTDASAGSTIIIPVAKKVWWSAPPMARQKSELERHIVPTTLYGPSDLHATDECGGFKVFRIVLSLFRNQMLGWFSNVNPQTRFPTHFIAIMLML